MREEPFEPAQCFHPGSYLKDEIQARGLSVEAFAVSLGLSPGAIQDVVDEQCPLCISVADRIARAWGQRIQFWVNLQEAFTLCEIRQMRRDLISWAEKNGELDSCWVVDVIGTLHDDEANARILFARIRESARRVDAERGL